ncbi:MAG: heavy-metal-associated domain-containing protein [Burkholderiaceae bacterium]
MHEFKLPDMSCGHCRAAVTDAIKAIDAHADVQVDLNEKSVKVNSALGEAQIAAVLSEAGYPPG